MPSVGVDIATIKDGVTLVAEQEGLAKFFGDRGEVAVTVKDELIPPRKTHEPEESAEMEKALRASPWWKQVSTIDRHTVVRILNATDAGGPKLRIPLAATASPVRQIRLLLRDTTS